MTRARRRHTTSGFFGVAVHNPKTEVNVGTLWRTAKTYNAALIATVGCRRYEVHQASDTCRTPNSVPMQHFTDIDDLIEHLPNSCPLVGVEMTDRAVSLTEFVHPTRALYLLGAEDHGLPPAILERCHKVIQIPTPAAWSLNVAVAGSLVIADRYVKLQQQKHSTEMSTR